MNQDEIKAMMLSFQRLQQKKEKSESNVKTINEMWGKMPSVVQHQLDVISEYRDSNDRLQADNERLREALKESVKLQSHYANLLNMYDGGERIIFKSSKEWLDRLIALKGGRDD